jgi:hypothetical protein
VGLRGDGRRRYEGGGEERGEGRAHFVKPPMTYFNFVMFLCSHTGQSTGAANWLRHCSGIDVLYVLWCPSS